MSGPFDGCRFPFRACGDDVTIYELVRVLDPEAIDVGTHVIVDDFVFLAGGLGTTIGSWVHIASFVSISGGGRLVVEDFAGIATGVRIVTGTDLMDGSGLTGPTIPGDLRSVRRGTIHIGRHVVIGANAVVLPDVTIGEGAIVGAGAVVTKSLEPWTINVGQPARPVGDRPSAEVLAREVTVRARDGA
ncbi:acyltransferase [Baekduia sp.]|uniref:acyltransferase n=1 Tax=Baekduia sp. TaxID=2600305 RepID=UPI002E02FDE1|nr:acyltransferase [Baekduia sp.]